MTDIGSRVSALAAQASMLNEVLRTFASVDFSLPLEPPRSPDKPGPADASSARGSAVTAGALATAARDDGAGRVLPPAEPDTPASAGGTEPARSLEGLRPPSLSPAPAIQAPVEPGRDDGTAGHGGVDPSSGLQPAAGAMVEPGRDGAMAGLQLPPRPGSEAEGRPRAAATPARPSAQPASEDAQASSAWRQGDDAEAARPATSLPVGPKAALGDASDAESATAGRTDSGPARPADAAATAPPLPAATLAPEADLGLLPYAADPAVPSAETAPAPRPTRQDGTVPQARAPRDDGALRSGFSPAKIHGAGGPAAERRGAAEPLPVIRHAAVADIDLRFFSDAASGAALGGGSLDAAGSAAMLVFNAAMIPGWPPPRPFAVPDAEAILTRLTGSPLLADREDEMAGRLGMPALTGAALKRLRRLPRSRRLRALLGLTALMDTIETVIEAVEGELLELSRAQHEDDDWTEAGVRRQLTA